MSAAKVTGSGVRDAHDPGGGSSRGSERPQSLEGLGSVDRGRVMMCPRGAEGEAPGVLETWLRTGRGSHRWRPGILGASVGVAT